jgi:hypothetical protein
MKEDDPAEPVEACPGGIVIGASVPGVLEPEHCDKLMAIAAQLPTVEQANILNDNRRQSEAKGIPGNVLRVNNAAISLLRGDLSQMKLYGFSEGVPAADQRRGPADVLETVSRAKASIERGFVVGAPRLVRDLDDWTPWPVRFVLAEPDRHTTSIIFSRPETSSLRHGSTGTRACHGNTGTRSCEEQRFGTRAPHPTAAVSVRWRARGRGGDPASERDDV